MLRTKLINGITAERDNDYTQLGLALSSTSVIEGLEVTTDSVSAGIWFVQVTRTATTPEEEILVKVELTEAETIDTSGTTKVWIEIEQENINDAGLNDSSGSVAGSVQTGTDYPTDNYYLPLASVVSGVITDERVFFYIKRTVEVKGRFISSENWTDTYTATIPGLTSYFDGLKVDLKTDIANTWPCTLNINSLGNIDIKKKQWTEDLSANDTSVNWIVTLIYNEDLGVFQYEGQSFNSVPGGLVATSCEAGEDITAQYIVRSWNADLLETVYNTLFTVIDETSWPGDYTEETLYTISASEITESTIYLKLDVELWNENTASNDEIEMRIYQGSTLLYTVYHDDGDWTEYNETYSFADTGEDITLRVYQYEQPVAYRNLYFKKRLIEDINKFYLSKANDADKLDFKGYALASASDDEKFSIVFDGLVPGFDFDLDTYNIWDPVYLQDDGSLGLTEGTNGVTVWNIYTETEMLLNTESDSGGTEQSFMIISWNGVDSTSGSWVTIDMSSVDYNWISGASLSSDTITLPAGSYIFERFVTVYDGAGQTRLRNTSDSSTIWNFGTATLSDTSDPSHTMSVWIAQETITGEKTYQIQGEHTASQSDGFGGQNYSLTNTERYAKLKITKIA